MLYYVKNQVYSKLGRSVRLACYISKLLLNQNDDIHDKLTQKQHIFNVIHTGLSLIKS